MRRIADSLCIWRGIVREALFIPLECDRCFSHVVASFETYTIDELNRTSVFCEMDGVL
jgi:hypothetical protein